MQPRTVLTVGNFFLAVSATLVSYTLLSYLSSFIKTEYIGLAISFGAICAVIAFFYLPKFVARIGAQQFALYIVFAVMLMLFAIASLQGTAISAVFVILVLSLQPLLFYNLDLLLEATMNEEGTTGRVRTIFLTGYNIGALIAPLLIGTLLATTDNYSYIFFTAGSALIPFIILFSARKLPIGEAPNISHIKETLIRLYHNRDLAAVTVGHFVLYLFYIWAPLYVPLYLHNVLEIPWSTLGIIFSIMNLPYSLIEYPAGWLADKVLGDKELMFSGFVIAGVSLASISLMTKDSSILVIAILLVATRIGAALIESMTEGHFFRRVSEKDVVSVSVFRGVWPLANSIAPLIGSLIFLIDGYNLFFIITGGIIFFAGTLSTLLVKDFR